MDVVRSLTLVLEALTPVAHATADPTAVSSNTVLFNRCLSRVQHQSGAVSRETVGRALQGVLAEYKLTAELQEFLQSITGAELLAILFTSSIPEIFGAGEGTGLFSGAERYRYLASRLGEAAAQSTSLVGAWRYLAAKLLLPLYPEQYYSRFEKLFALPKPIQLKILAAIEGSLELVVMGAREVAAAKKRTNINYAIASGSDLAPAIAYQPTEEQIDQLCSEQDSWAVIKIPTISGNSLRHCLLREPGADHLFRSLGFDPATNPAPIGIERLFYSGGNVAAKAKQPAAADIIEATVRKNYPLLDALGGSVDQFLFSRSAVAIAGWVVCAENNWITSQWGISSPKSVFEFLEERTHTRHGRGGHDRDSGQMIFNFETLAPGHQLVLEILFQPFTPPLTRGAVFQAIQEWQSRGLLGARGATGHGRYALTTPLCEEYQAEAAAYREYLELNRERLAQGIADRTLGTEVVLCAA